MSTPSLAEVEKLVFSQRHTNGESFRLDPVWAVIKRYIPGDNSDPTMTAEYIVVKSDLPNSKPIHAICNNDPYFAAVQGWEETREAALDFVLIEVDRNNHYKWTVLILPRSEMLSKHLEKTIKDDRAGKREYAIVHRFFPGDDIDPAGADPYDEWIVVQEGSISLKKTCKDDSYNAKIIDYRETLSEALSFAVSCCEFSSNKGIVIYFDTIPLFRNHLDYLPF